ncbi:MAG: 50S ribosomal protein L18 [Candidatus Paceibacteria bacterium]
MKNPLKIKIVHRIRRHKRVRSKIFGRPERPRLSVFRSSKHIWAQLIDDTVGHTLVSASSKELKLKGKKTKSEKAFLVGELLAKKAKSLGIKKAVFDRGGYKFHGRVAQLAKGALNGGLKI